jgi:hypothetical protein
MQMLDAGIDTDETGPWDASNNSVEILRWDNPNMYHGEN